MRKRMQDLKKIASIDQLKREALDEADFALLLNYGLYSRKTIKYNPRSDKFSVWHHIDNTKQRVTEAELEETNIGEGIREGAFVKLDESYP